MPKKKSRYSKIGTNGLLMLMALSRKVGDVVYQMAKKVYMWIILASTRVNASMKKLNMSSERHKEVMASLARIERRLSSLEAESGLANEDRIKNYGDIKSLLLQHLEEIEKTRKNTQTVINKYILLRKEK